MNFEPTSVQSWAYLTELEADREVHRTSGNKDKLCEKCNTWVIRVYSLCYLMTPGLGKDIWCHVWPYSI